MPNFIFQRWQQWHQAQQPPDRMPALPMGDHGSKLVVVGIAYGQSDDVIPGVLANPTFEQAWMYSNVSDLSDNPVPLNFTCNGTKSCYFRYYGIWRYCAKHLTGGFSVEPYFCELFPVCKGNPYGRNFAYDAQATNHIIAHHLGQLNSKKQVIILNGWSLDRFGNVRRFPDNDSVREFFAANPERTEHLRQRLQQRLRDDFNVGGDNSNHGIGPQSPFAFVTNSGFICLRTHHSGRHGQKLLVGHLLTAIKTCLEFAAQ